MIIPPTNHGSISAAAPDPRRPGTGIPRVATDRIALNQKAQLQAALKETPEVRPEVVARGRDLATDPAYPPLEIINRLATLISSSKDLSVEE